MNKTLLMQNKSGSVSMFAVMFFILLSVVIIGGFVRVAIQDQLQTFSRNLSQSAFDSALTGVEDAKRLLTNYYKECTESSGGKCATLREAIDLTQNEPSANSCNAAVSLLNSDSIKTDEVLIKKDENSDYNQAYTCVKIERNTDDYLGTLLADQSKTIPLIGVSQFNKIKIEWFSSKDLGSNTFGLAAPWPKLFTSELYKKQYPPLLSATLIQSSNSFNSSDLDQQRNFAKVIFYPSNINKNTFSFLTASQSNTNETNCRKPDGDRAYSCSIIVDIPEVDNKYVTLLQLKSLYNNADFKLSLFNNENIVKFNQVQTKVDSTGRASDLYRRLETRLETVFTDAYPDSAVEVSGNFCKDFGLTALESSPFTTECKPWEP